MCVIVTKTHPKSVADGDSDPRISQTHPKSMADGDPPAHGVEANILHLLKISNSSISNTAHRPYRLIVCGVHLWRIFAALKVFSSSFSRLLKILQFLSDPSPIIAIGYACQ